jgi:hypothetical protein
MVVAVLRRTITHRYSAFGHNRHNQKKSFSCAGISPKPSFGKFVSIGIDNALIDNASLSIGIGPKKLSNCVRIISSCSFDATLVEISFV